MIITYEMFQNVKIKIELGEPIEEHEQGLKQIIQQGKKYTSVVESILKESNIDEEQLGQYCKKIDALIKKLGFASEFLVKELPNTYISTFDKSKWQAITKISSFPKLDYDAKKACLMLCGVFGVFETDGNADIRTEDFKRFLQKLTPEELKKYSRFQMNYDPQFLDFFIANKDKLNQEQLDLIQNKWNEIRRSVEIKNTTNVLRYIEYSKEENGDSFQAY